MAAIEIPAELFAILLAGQIWIAMHDGAAADCVVERNPLPLRRQRRIPARAVRSIVDVRSLKEEGICGWLVSSCSLKSASGVRKTIEVTGFSEVVGSYD